MGPASEKRVQKYKNFQYLQHPYREMFFLNSWLFLLDVCKKILFLHHHTGMFFVGGYGYLHDNYAHSI